MISLTNAITDSSSRPQTQSSIQSSNPGLYKPRYKNHGKVDVNDDDEEYDGNDGNDGNDDMGDENDQYVTYRPQVFREASPEFDFENTGVDGFYQHDAISPINDYKDSTNVGLSSGLDFLNDVPNSSVKYGYKELSSEIHTSKLSAFPNSEYTSSSKITPCALKYDEFSANTKIAYHRMKAIEELMETEESYISSMKMLTDIYLESLITKGSDGIPIRLIHDYIGVLISNHQSFLYELRSLFFTSYKNNSNFNVDSPCQWLKSQDYIEPSSTLMSSLVSELISKKAISVYFYQELTSAHSMVLKLMSAKESDPEFGLTLTRVNEIP